MDRGPKAKGTNSIVAQSKKVQHLRGALMAIEQALGVPVKDIAERYQVSAGTVRRALDSAEAEGLVEHFKSLVFERLIGKALAVYEAHLDMGNLDAARDVAFGLGVLLKDPSKGKDAPKPIETLAAYRAERAKTAIVVEEGTGTDTNAQKH